MNALLNEFSAYWLNFALHTALLSSLVWLTCRLMRDPARRAYIAAVGIGAICVLPWISAMRLGPQPTQPSPIETRAEQVNSIGEATPTSSPIWTIHLERNSVSSIIAGSSNPGSPQNFEATKFDPAFAIGLVWVTGTFIGLLGLFIHQFRTFRWMGSFRNMNEFEREAVQKCDIDPAKCRVSMSEMSPCVVGLIRPKMVIPQSLFDPHHAVKLNWAIKHELEHLRAGDSQVALLLSLARAILWWNPIVHSLCTLWSFERERVCDARATECDHSQIEYGNFLLELSAKISSPAQGAVFMATSGQVRRMKRRLSSLVGGQPVVRMTAIFKAAIVAIAITSGLAMSGAGIAWADENYISEEEVVETPTIDSVIAEATSPAETEMVEETPSKLGQLKFTMVAVATKDPLPEAGQTLNEAERALLMTRFKALPENEIIVAPSVLMHYGENATIEIIWELIWGNVGDVPKVDRYGWYAGFKAENHGDKAMLEVESNHAYLPDHYNFGNPTKPPEGYEYQGDRVVNSAKLRDYEMMSGETAVVQFDQKEKGKFVTALMTLTATDDTGSPIPSFGTLLPKSTDRVIPGKIRVSGEVFESLNFPSVEGDNQLAERKRFHRGLEILGIFNGDQFESVKASWKEKNPDFSPVELKSVEVESGVEAQPWERFSNFFLKASMVPDDLYDLELRDSVKGGSTLALTVNGVNQVILVRLINENGGDPRVFCLKFEE